MSDKQSVIIEADDVTIIQGEKTKDYNIRVTKIDGSPISNLPVTIAFYNKDNTFIQNVQTNEFGNATTPIRLNGDSWKVDVHFKGNNEYLPNIVTKEVNFLKFERKMTYIESENLHLNEDNVTSTDEGWYTVYLYDEDDLPIVDEPISFNIVSTKNDVDDVDFILETDDLGRIVVPYLTHNDTVVVTVDYKGCTRYSPFSRSDILTFDDIADRTDVSFRVGDNNTRLQIKFGNGNWEDIWTSSQSDRIRCIVNYPNDDRTVNDGMFYYYSMNAKTYKVTLFYKGTSNYFSKMQTLTFEKSNDSRKPLSEWIATQDGASFIGQWEYSSLFKNAMAHFSCSINFVTPSNLLHCYISTIPLNRNWEEFIESVVYDFYTVPQFREDDGIIKTFVDIYFKVPNLNTFYLSFFWDSSDYTSSSDIVAFIVELNPSLWKDNLESTTLSVTGFGANNNSYNNLEILATRENIGIHQNANNYYIMRLLNKDTLEEFYFSGYLIDKVTPSKLNFNLGLGEWDMLLIGQAYAYGSNGGASGLYQTSAIISNDEPIIYVDDLFYDPNNWEGIVAPSIIDKTITSSSIASMTEEFTSVNSNYYLNSKYKMYDDELESYILLGSLDTNSIEILYNPFGTLRLEITVRQNGETIDYSSKMDSFIGEWKNLTITKEDGKTNIYIDEELVYSTDIVFDNYLTLGKAILKDLTLYVEPQADITPSTDDYDGSVYGSDLHLEVRNDKINLYDYGMLPSGAIGSAKVIASDIPLTTDQLALELEIKYNNNRFERLDNLTGEMQIRAYENALTSQESEDYAKTLCSPMPVADVETVFTRHSDEGTLYYIKDPRLTGNAVKSPTYLCNAYTQYKGGVEIQTETGISLFDLDNAYSPVYVGNDLVRAEFHRRSGFIKISRYDENSDSWATVNVLKLRKEPQLILNTYNDDYAEVQFGATTWKFYRGRPFIIVNHRNDDLRILNLVDRVYCEIIENNRVMGFIEEKDAVCGIFNPQLSIQQFKQEMHIGQNIKLDNFELYDIANNNDIIDVSEDSTLTLATINEDSAIQINKNTTDKVGLNFPSYSNYVKRVGDKTKPVDFSLLIEKIETTGSAQDTMQVSIKARGFDERGAIPLYNGHQYGIWEQTQTVEVDTTITDSIRVSFTDCPVTVEYIDFIVILQASDDIIVKMQDFMYYEGKDIDIEHDIDTSKITAEQMEIIFSETYFANIYNEDDNYGLCIVRPNQEPISLRKIYANEETVLIPYMKKSTYWDKPNQVFLEYLNSKRQVIDIEKEY